MAKSAYKKIPNYVKNVNKSVMYSTMDIFKEVTPNISEFLSSNSEIIQEVSNDARNLKSVSRVIRKNIQSSDTVRLAKEYKSNFLEDLKSGNLYNKERAEKQSAEALGLDSLMDMSMFDDLDKDTVNTTFDSDDKSSTTVNKTISPRITVNNIKPADNTNAFQNIAKTSAVAIYKTGEYVTETQKSLYESFMTNQYKSQSEVSARLSEISGYVKGLFNYTQNITTHMEKTHKFYDESITVMRRLDALNKEATEMQRVLYEGYANKTNAQYKETPYDNVLGSGTFNIKSYGDMLKKNAQNAWETSSMGSMMSMAGGGNPLKLFTASPLQFITTYLARASFPGGLKKSLTDFDGTLQNFFKSGMLKFSSTSRNKGADNPLWDFANKLFGINPDRTEKINPGSYVQGPVPFDGITRQSIVEVIPTYLRKILSALTSTSEQHYDFSKGKFMDTKEVRENRDRLMEESYSRMNNTRFNINKRLGAVHLDDKYDAKQLQDDSETLIRFLSDKGYFLNPHDKNTNYEKLSSEGLVLKGSDNTFDVLKSAFKSLTRQELMSVNSDIYESAKFRKDYMKNLNQNMMDRGISSLYNGTNSDEYLNLNGLGRANKGKKSSKNNNPLDIDNTPREGSRTFSSLADLRGHGDNYVSNIMSNYAQENDGKDLISQTEDRVSKERKSLLYKFFGKSNKYDGLKKLKEGKDKIFNAPLNFLGGLLHQADKELFELVYGTGSTSGDRSFLQATGQKIRNGIDNIWFKLDEKVLTPLNEKLFGKEGIMTRIKDKINPKMDKVKNFVLGSKIGNSREGGLVSDTYNHLMDMKSELFNFISGKGYTSRVTKNEVAGRKDSVKTEITNIVTKTRDTLSTQLFGEKILDEEGNKIGRKDGGMVNSIKKSFTDLFSTFSKDMTGKEPGQKKYDLSGIKKALPKMGAGAILGGMSALVMPYGLLGGMLLGSGASYASTSEKFKEKIFGKEVDGERQGGMVNKEMQVAFKKYAPSMAASGVLGAVSSIMLPGGPLMWGLLGSGIGIAKQSEKFKEWMFGKTDKATGEIDDSSAIINQQHLKFIKKAIPAGIVGLTLGKVTGGVVASNMGIMGKFLLPGGPIGGAVLGLSAGILTQSDSVKNMLFGEYDESTGKRNQATALIREEHLKFMKKSFPASAIGALGGLATHGLVASKLGVIGNFLLPGGPIGSAMLGIGLGIASQTDTVKEMLFGNKKDNDKRKGGIIGKAGIWFKTEIGEPLKIRLREAVESVRHFGVKSILNPMKDAIEPVKKQFKLVADTIKQGVKDRFINIKNSMDNVFEKTIGAPIGKFMNEHVFNPMKKLTNKIFSGIGKVIGAVISSPVKLFNTIAMGFMSKQTKDGIDLRTMEDVKESKTRNIAEDKLHKDNMAKLAKEKKRLSLAQDSIREGKYNEENYKTRAGVKLINKFTKDGKLHAKLDSNPNEYYTKASIVVEQETQKIIKEQSESVKSQTQIMKEGFKQLTDSFRDFKDNFILKFSDDKNKRMKAVKGLRGRRAYYSEDQVNARETNRKQQAIFKSLNGSEGIMTDILDSQFDNINIGSDKKRLDIKRLSDNLKVINRSKTNKNDDDVIDNYKGLIMNLQLFGHKKSGKGSLMDKMIGNDKKENTSKKMDGAKKVTNMSGSTIKSVISESKILNAILNKVNGIYQHLTGGRRKRRKNSTSTSDTGDDSEGAEQEEKKQRSTVKLFSSIDKNVKEINNEIFGQLDGVGYHTEMIANILVDQFGYPSVMPKGIRATRGHLIRGTFDKIKRFLKRPVEFLQGLITEPINYIKDKFGALADMIKAPFKAIGQAVSWTKDKLTDLGSYVATIPGKLVKAGKGLFDFAKSVFTGAGQALMTTVGVISKGVTSVFKTARTFMGDMYKGTKIIISDAYKTVREFGKSFFSAMSDGVKMVGSFGKAMAKVTFSYLADFGIALKNGAKTVTSFVIDVTKKLAGFVFGLFGGGKKEKTGRNVKKVDYVEYVKTVEQVKVVHLVKRIEDARLDKIVSILSDIKSIMSGGKSNNVIPFGKPKSSGQGYDKVNDKMTSRKAELTQYHKGKIEVENAKNVKGTFDLLNNAIGKKGFFSKMGTVLLMFLPKLMTIGKSIFKFFKNPSATLGKIFSGSIIKSFTNNKLLKTLTSTLVTPITKTIGKIAGIFGKKKATDLTKSVAKDAVGGALQKGIKGNIQNSKQLMNPTATDKKGVFGKVTGLFKRNKDANVLKTPTKATLKKVDSKGVKSAVNAKTLTKGGKGKGIKGLVGGTMLNMGKSALAGSLQSSVDTSGITDIIRNASNVIQLAGQSVLYAPNLQLAGVGGGGGFGSPSNLIDNVPFSVKDVAKSAVDSKVKKSATKKITGEVAENVAEKGVKSLAAPKAGGIMGKIDDIIGTIMKSKLAQKVFGNFTGIINSVKKFVIKAVKKLPASSLGSLTKKAAAKASALGASAATTFGIGTAILVGIDVAQAGLAATTEAREILQVHPGVKITLKMRAACGIAQFIENNITFGFIDLHDIAVFIYNLIADDTEKEALSTLQESFKAEHEASGSDQSFEEYNKTQNKSFVSKAKDTVKGWGSSAWGAVKGFGSSVWGEVKNTGKAMGDFFFGNGPSEDELGGGIAPPTSPAVDTANNLVYYSQRDPKWSDTPYRTRSEGTIGSSGCGPTAAAMVLSSFTGKSVSPVEAADFAAKKGHRVPGAGTGWGYFEDIGKTYGVDFATTGTSPETIKSSLKQGKPVVLTGNGAEPFTKGGHYVVATGLNSDSTKIRISDPVSKERSREYSTQDVLGRIRNSFTASQGGQGLKGVPSSLSGGVDGTGEAQEKDNSVFGIFEQIGGLTKGFIDSSMKGEEFDPNKLEAEKAGFSGGSTSLDGVSIGGGQLSPNLMQFMPDFKKAGQKYNVEPEILQAIAMQESGGNPRAGYPNQPAWGLMQIENTLNGEFGKFGQSYEGKYYGSQDRIVPSKAIPFAANRFSSDLKHYNGDYTKAIQAYNFSKYSLDMLLKKYPDEWMGRRKEMGSINGVGGSYGDPKYVENVLRYYKGSNIKSGGQQSFGDGPSEAELKKSEKAKPKNPMSGVYSELASANKKLKEQQIPTRRLMNSQDVSDIVSGLYKSPTCNIETLMNDSIPEIKSLKGTSTDMSKVIELLTQIVDNTASIDSNTKVIADKDTNVIVENKVVQKDANKETDSEQSNKTNPIYSIARDNSSANENVNRGYDMARVLATGVK